MSDKLFPGCLISARWLDIPGDFWSMKREKDQKRRQRFLIPTEGDCSVLKDMRETIEGSRELVDLWSPWDNYQADLNFLTDLKSCKSQVDSLKNAAAEVDINQIIQSKYKKHYPLIEESDQLSMLRERFLKSELDVEPPDPDNIVRHNFMLSEEVFPPLSKSSIEMGVSDKARRIFRKLDDPQYFMNSLPEQPLLDWPGGEKVEKVVKIGLLESKEKTMNILSNYASDSARICQEDESVEININEAEFGEIIKRTITELKVQITLSNKGIFGASLTEKTVELEPCSIMTPAVKEAETNAEVNRRSGEEETVPEHIALYIISEIIEVCCTKTQPTDLDDSGGYNEDVELIDEGSNDNFSQDSVVILSDISKIKELDSSSSFILLMKQNLSLKKINSSPTDSSKIITPEEQRHQNISHKQENTTTGQIDLIRNKNCGLNPSDQQNNKEIVFNKHEEETSTGNEIMSDREIPNPSTSTYNISSPFNDNISKFTDEDGSDWETRNEGKFTFDSEVLNISSSPFSITSNRSELGIRMLENCSYEDVAEDYNEDEIVHTSSHTIETCQVFQKETNNQSLERCITDELTDDFSFPHNGLNYKKQKMFIESASQELPNTMGMYNHSFNVEVLEPLELKGETVSTSPKIPQTDLCFKNGPKPVEDILPENVSETLEILKKGLNHSIEQVLLAVDSIPNNESNSSFEMLHDMNFRDAESALDIDIIIAATKIEIQKDSLNSDQTELLLLLAPKISLSNNEEMYDYQNSFIHQDDCNIIPGEIKYFDDKSENDEIKKCRSEEKHHNVKDFSFKTLGFGTDHLESVVLINKVIEGKKTLDLDKALLNNDIFSPTLVKTNNIVCEEKKLFSQPAVNEEQNNISSVRRMTTSFKAPFKSSVSQQNINVSISNNKHVFSDLLKQGMVDGHVDKYRVNDETSRSNQINDDKNHGDNTFNETKVIQLSGQLLNINKDIVKIDKQATQVYINNILDNNDKNATSNLTEDKQALESTCILDDEVPGGLIIKLPPIPSVRQKSDIITTSDKNILEGVSCVRETLDKENHLKDNIEKEGVISGRSTKTIQDLSKLPYMYPFEGDLDEFLTQMVVNELLYKPKRAPKTINKSVTYLRRRKQSLMKHEQPKESSETEIKEETFELSVGKTPAKKVLPSEISSTQYDSKSMLMGLCRKEMQKVHKSNSNEELCNTSNESNTRPELIKMYDRSISHEVNFMIPPSQNDVNEDNPNVNYMIDLSEMDKMYDINKANSRILDEENCSLRNKLKNQMKTESIKSVDEINFTTSKSIPDCQDLNKKNTSIEKININSPKSVNNYVSVIEDEYENISTASRSVSGISNISTSSRCVLLLDWLAEDDQFLLNLESNQGVIVFQRSSSSYRFELTKFFLLPDLMIAPQTGVFVLKTPITNEEMYERVKANMTRFSLIWVVVVDSLEVYLECCALVYRINSESCRLNVLLSTWDQMVDLLGNLVHNEIRETEYHLTEYITRHEMLLVNLLPALINPFAAQTIVSQVGLIEFMKMSRDQMLEKFTWLPEFVVESVLKMTSRHFDISTFSRDPDMSCGERPTGFHESGNYKVTDHLQNMKVGQMTEYAEYVSCTQLENQTYYETDDDLNQLPISKNVNKSNEDSRCRGNKQSDGNSVKDLKNCYFSNHINFDDNFELTNENSLNDHDDHLDLMCGRNGRTLLNNSHPDDLKQCRTVSSVDSGTFVHSSDDLEFANGNNIAFTDRRVRNPEHFGVINTGSLQLEQDVGKPENFIYGNGEREHDHPTLYSRNTLPYAFHNDEISEEQQLFLQKDEIDQELINGPSTRRSRFTFRR